MDKTQRMELAKRYGKTLRVESTHGLLMKTYPGQQQAQGRYIEVYADGRLVIDYNAEIGNAVPAAVWHGKIRRIYGPWTTKAAAREFIEENRELFHRLVAGMDERWDGNNYSGTVTDDARDAEESLDYNAINYDAR